MFSICDEANITESLGEHIWIQRMNTQNKPMEVKKIQGIGKIK
jgi:hypothetical protein